MSTFIKKFASAIVATWCCFDRVIFKGYLPFGDDAHLNSYVDWVMHIRRKDFIPMLKDHSETLVGHAKASPSARGGPGLPNMGRLSRKRRRPFRPSLFHPRFAAATYYPAPTGRCYLSPGANASSASVCATVGIFSHKPVAPTGNAVIGFGSEILGHNLSFPQCHPLFAPIGAAACSWWRKPPVTEHPLQSSPRRGDRNDPRHPTLSPLQGEEDCLNRNPRADARGYTRRPLRGQSPPPLKEQPIQNL